MTKRIKCRNPECNRKSLIQTMKITDGFCRPCHLEKKEIDDIANYYKKVDSIKNDLDSANSGEIKQELKSRSICENDKIYFSYFEGHTNRLLSIVLKIKHDNSLVFVISQNNTNDKIGVWEISNELNNIIDNFLNSKIDIQEEYESYFDGPGWCFLKINHNNKIISTTIKMPFKELKLHTNSDKHIVKLSELILKEFGL